MELNREYINPQNLSKFLFDFGGMGVSRPRRPFITAVQHTKTHTQITQTLVSHRQPWAALQYEGTKSNGKLIINWIEQRII